jgi:hypothetical protein
VAEIVLTRPAGYRTDRLRPYRVIIDDKKVGAIKPGETEVFSLPPGSHELQLKIDWASSEKLQVDLGDDDQVKFVCTPRVKEDGVTMVIGLKMIYWLTFGFRRYIDLHHGNELAAANEPERWLHNVSGLMLFGIALVIGVVFWALTGQNIVVSGVVVAAVAVVLSGVVARGISKVAVQISTEVQKRRDG